MAILTERKVWTRRPTAPLPLGRKLSRLTQDQQENVRRALRYLATRYGGSKKLAAALGVSYEAFWKLRIPSRQVPARRAMLVANLAGVDVGEVLSGRWPGDRCPHCDGTGLI